MLLIYIGFEVLIAATIKNTIYYPEDGGSKSLRKICGHLTDYSVTSQEIVLFMNTKHELHDAIITECLNCSNVCILK
jgi:hypothetical protein